jgi:hypothetical protein
MKTEPIEIIVKDEGTFVPGLGIVDIPRRITRGINGWRITGDVLVKGGRTNFSDKRYGGPDKSFLATLEEVSKHIKLIKKSGYALSPLERKHKTLKLGCSGVIYNVCVCKRKDKPDVITHRFIVSNPNTNKTTTVYIGTDNTYQDNWDKCLDKAKSLREKFLKEYKTRHQWDGL